MNLRRMRMTKTGKAILAVTLLAILASAIPVAAQSSYSLRMSNNSGYDIYQIRLSPVSDVTWHHDLLGPWRVFEDGTSFTITQISADRYDILFIDEDADVCKLHDVAIYSDLSWDLSRMWLLNCERLSER